jgi:hypothetical protein
VWVRSGSASGAGGFGQHLEQHTKQAESDTNQDNSQFMIITHPPRAFNQRARVSKGYMNILKHILERHSVGMTFHQEYFPKTTMACSFTVMKTFEWIKHLHCHGKPLKEKYVQMVANLFELGYDLAISWTHNVLNSPGFEGCGLMLNNK